MKLSIQFAVTFLTISFITIGHPQAAQAADFDHSKFDQVLKTYVDRQGRVDYNGIAGDAAFREYMVSLENAKADSLSRDGQLAFWINAYNAVTIDKVIKWKPKKVSAKRLCRGFGPAPNSLRPSNIPWQVNV